MLLDHKDEYGSEWAGVFNHRRLQEPIGNFLPAEAERAIMAA